MNHKRPYLSTSALKAFAKSPNHYIQYVNRAFEPTPAMELGSAIHCRVLEPKEWDARYIEAPKVDRRTKAGKADWEEFIEAAGERTVLTFEQMRLVEAAHAAVWSDRLAADLLEAAQAFEQMSETQIEGVPYRGVADAIGPDFIVDLKTTTDASADAFTRQAYNLMYHEQAAAYREIFDRPRFFFITVETVEPFNTQVFIQDERSYQMASNHLHSLVKRWKDWNGEPQTYSNEIQTLQLPKWV